MNPYLKATIDGLAIDPHPQVEGNVDEANIVVNESIGRAAFYYEKIRNVIDYQDERLFLKNAIKRILLRRTFFGSGDNASRLLRELVWAKYFENDQIPVSKSEEIASILRKYDFIRQNIKSRKKTNQINRMVLGLASCEVETHLSRPISRRSFVEYAKQIIKKNIDLRENDIDSASLDICIEILLERNIFKSDLDILRFELLRRYNQYWPDINKEEAQAFCVNFDKIMDSIDHQIDKSRNNILSRYIKRYIPPFLIIWEIINQNPRVAGDLLKDQSKLAEASRAVIERKTKNIKKKVFRAVSRGIIFILLTKISLAFVIEVPYELNTSGQINYPALLTNSIFPPLVMLISGLFIKIPGKKNTSILLKIINSAVFEEEITFAKLTSLKKSRKRSNIIFNAFYFLISMAILALVGWGLVYFNFGVVSIALFFIFVSIVSSLAFRIRATARELEVKSSDEGLFGGFLGIILLPFIIIGKFLSDKWAEYNFTLLFWDFIIEAPFKTIIGFLEGWFYFLREKREDFE